jgi:hypothetical protein
VTEAIETVWIERDDLLSTMSLAAIIEAQHRLSLEGKEVFEMLLLAEHKGIDPVEAFSQANAIDGLADYDQRTIEIYLARITLIDDFKTFEG